MKLGHKKQLRKSLLEKWVTLLNSSFAKPFPKFKKFQLDYSDQKQIAIICATDTFCGICSGHTHYTARWVGFK